MQSTPFTAEALPKVIETLKAGGIVAHAADTCFGLLGDVQSQKAMATIQDIKGRDGLKPMSIMLPMGTDIAEYAMLFDYAKEVANKLLPGPVTLLLPKGPKIPEHYFPETNLIGIRVPEDEETQSILQGFGAALITTSANRSGAPLCFTHEEVMHAFKNTLVQPDMLLEGKSERHSQASTVILVGENELQIMREGPITKVYLEDVFNFSVK